MIWHCGDFRLDLSKTRVMAIVNVTPDSFSDGGRYFRPEEAAARARNCLAEGADILDLGGESTRPGATPLEWKDEWSRLEPVLALMSEKERAQRGKLYLFGRYDQYDSYVPAEGLTDIGWCSRQVVSGGVNYYPLPQVALKAEGGVRLLGEQYNNEPYFALGITWTGFFNR